MNFSQRFDIKVDLAEAQRRFINRVFNTVFEMPLGDWIKEGWWHQQIMSATAFRLGERFVATDTLDSVVGRDLMTCLLAIETFYELAGGEDGEKHIRDRIGEAVEYALNASEADLGIEWHDGIFTRKGAKLLDENLVSESLHWLSDSGYDNVRKPFEKSLGHFLESAKKPELLSDAITDAYEALEALAKIICANKKDLSGNRELFLSNLKASEEFKELLKQYIDFANDFRHAADPKKPKPTLTEPEVEFFVYMTGAFIRMAKESLAKQKQKES